MRWFHWGHPLANFFSTFRVVNHTWLNTIYPVNKRSRPHTTNFRQKVAFCFRKIPFTKPPHRLVLQPLSCQQKKTLVVLWMVHQLIKSKDFPDLQGFCNVLAPSQTVVVFRISKPSTVVDTGVPPWVFPHVGITWSPDHLWDHLKALRIQRAGVEKSRSHASLWSPGEFLVFFLGWKGWLAHVHIRHNHFFIFIFVLASAESLRRGLWDLSRGSLLRFVLRDTPKIYSRVSFCSCLLCCCWYCASVQEMHDCNSRICAYIIIAISYCWYIYIVIIFIIHMNTFRWSPSMNSYQSTLFVCDV